MKVKLFVCGGGDSSVGIPDVNATITIEDNLIDTDGKMTEDWKEILSEYYDVEKRHVMTEEDLKEVE